MQEVPIIPPALATKFPPGSTVRLIDAVRLCIWPRKIHPQTNSEKCRKYYAKNRIRILEKQRRQRVAAQGKVT